MADIPPTFTVRDAMLACGLVDGPPVFQGETQAQCVASDIFHDSFASCIDKTYGDLNKDLEAFAGLTAATGQIRFPPRLRTHIKAFIQWTCNEIRMGRDPSTTEFPVDNYAPLLVQAQTHKRFVNAQEIAAKAAKPKQLTIDTKWNEWIPTFRSYLHQIPGCHGVPLNYVIRDHVAPDP